VLRGGGSENLRIFEEAVSKARFTVILRSRNDEVELLTHPLHFVYQHFIKICDL
jgi:hypothetical protein